MLKLIKIIQTMQSTYEQRVFLQNPSINHKDPRTTHYHRLESSLTWAELFVTNMALLCSFFFIIKNNLFYSSKRKIDKK